MPLVILKAIQPFLEKTGKNYMNNNSKNNLLQFLDVDPESDFYFNIVQIKNENGNKVLLDYKPSSQYRVGQIRSWVDISEINKHFTLWDNLLQSYEKVQSPFNDPIIDSFRDDYLTEFEIIDEEKDKPLKPKQILLLNNYFENVDKKIDEYINDSNAEQIKEIKNDISELQDNLSSKTKFWIANKISWIWAKITKLGPKLMKDILNESNKQIVKESISQIIEVGKNLIS